MPLSRSEAANVEVGIGALLLCRSGGAIESAEEVDRLGGDQLDQPVECGGDPDRQLRSRHAEGRPRRRHQSACQVSLPGPGQVGGRLQQQRQHDSLGVRNRRILDEWGFLRGFGEPVHLHQQLREVNLIIGQQSGQQDAVLLDHVSSKEPPDLLGPLGSVSAAWRVGQPFDG